MGGILLIEREKPRSPFHAFKHFIPYSRFSKSDKTDLEDCSARVVSNIFDFLHFKISQNSMLEQNQWGGNRENNLSDFRFCS